jgi:hypothetical protein
LRLRGLHPRVGLSDPAEHAEIMSRLAAAGKRPEQI